MSIMSIVIHIQEERQACSSKLPSTLLRFKMTKICTSNSKYEHFHLSICLCHEQKHILARIQCHALHHTTVRTMNILIMTMKTSRTTMITTAMTTKMTTTMKTVMKTTMKMMKKLEVETILNRLQKI